MNNKTLKILGGALGVQVLLAAFTWMPGSGATGVAVDLVSIDRDAVTSLTIVGGPDDEDPLTLEKADGGWVLPDLGGYPAKGEKVAEVLDVLAALSAGRPIATNATSHSSLSVGDNEFGRKVTLSDGSSAQTLLIGAASGKAINVRAEGSSDVFLARGVNLWTIADSARTYFEPELISVDPASLESLSIRNGLGSIDLVREPTGWAVVGAPEGSGVDAGEIDRIVRKVAAVRMTEPVGTDVLPTHGLSGGTRVDWSVAVEGTSEPGGFTLGAEDGSDLYLKADGSPFVVKVSKGLFGELSELTLGDVLVTP